MLAMRGASQMGLERRTNEALYACPRNTRGVLRAG